MAHSLILSPRRWTIRDLLDSIRFPRRRATILPAVWVDELMQKRFGTLIVCAACRSKYRDGLRRWAYAPHPNMMSRGNACDFCQTVPLAPMPLWFKEEHRYATATGIAGQVRASAHQRFLDDRRIPWAHRPLPQRQRLLTPTTQVTFAGQRLH